MERFPRPLDSVSLRGRWFAVWRLLSPAVSGSRNCSADARIQSPQLGADARSKLPPRHGSIVLFSEARPPQLLIEVTQSLYERFSQPLSPILYRMRDTHAHRYVSVRLSGLSCYLLKQPNLLQGFNDLDASRHQLIVSRD